MAELTVPKFFTIEQKVEDGLDLGKICTNHLEVSYARP